LLPYPLALIEPCGNISWNPKMTRVFAMQDKDQYACISGQGSPVNFTAICQWRICHRHCIPNITVVHGSNTNPFRLEWHFVNQLTNHHKSSLRGRLLKEPIIFVVVFVDILILT
jgi:hypothetical protein